MFTRREVLAGLLGLVSTPAMASRHGHSPTNHGAAKPKAAAAPLDAVIDISHSTRVSDFHAARKSSRILGVIHKASEGGDWADPLYAQRRIEAEHAGLLWGAYHFGTRSFSGTEQAKMFLRTARPSAQTLMALDLEYNHQNPSNTMTYRQAEDFVRTVVAATGRKPLIYTTAAWADNQPSGPYEYRLGRRITEDSILASCPLWLADYRAQPQLPSAWRGKGWHFWQYAGDMADGGARSGRTRRVAGIDSCDRNFFRGTESTLRQFWSSPAAKPRKA